MIPTLIVLIVIVTTVLWRKIRRTSPDEE